MTDQVTYPPEPWQLRGQMHLSVWLALGDARGTLPVPPGTHVLRIAGRAVLGTAWVDYQAGGVLSYRELLVAALVRDGVRPRATITGIWVDSVPSRDGGRALWAIPKELARVVFGTAAGRFTADACIDGQPIASALMHRGVRLPGRWPVRFRVVQDRGGQSQTTRVQATARVHVGRSQWRIAPDGPLAYLRGLRPRVTVTLADFRVTFGSASDRSTLSESTAVAGSR
jgi:Acetoacetate decarboxylase (ADC)